MTQPQRTHATLLAALIGIWSALMPAWAVAQTRWKVDPPSSTAWWQVDPHLNHLWATTCTQDPSWRPGEDRSGGWNYDSQLKMPEAGYANVVDTMQLPLFPRLGPAEPICAEAVTGSITVQDPATWQGVTGRIAVKGEALQTGSTLRDAFARRAVLQTSRYTQITFSIDSVIPVSLGDTLRGTFTGTLYLVGTGRKFEGPVTAWREGPGLRVQARFRIPAAWLTAEFGISRYALGLGVTTGLWRSVYAGVDVLLLPEGAPPPDLFD